MGPKAICNLFASCRKIFDCCMQHTFIIEFFILLVVANPFACCKKEFNTFLEQKQKRASNSFKLYSMSVLICF